MKKILYFLLVILMSVTCFFGCAKSSNGDENSGLAEGTIDPSAEKESMPDYLESDEKVFNIGMWVGVPQQCPILDEYDRVTGYRTWTDEEFLEQYQWIADAGFTIAAPPQGTSSQEHILRMLDAAESVGIKQLIWDENVNTILLNTSLSDDDAMAQVRRAMVYYSDHPALYGNMITDEPQMQEYDALGVGEKRYKALFPDKMYYLNLFPVVATTDQLGGNSYDEYLTAYIEKVTDEYLCYDHYPLLPGTNGGSRLVEDFLWNMELAQKYMQKSKGEVWTFLQSMGYSNKKDPNCEEDFRSQAAAALAYGIRGIQWFCYCSPGYGGIESFTPAIIALDSTKTQKYDMVKKVNNEILAFDDIYLNFEWKRVMTFIGSNNSKKENNAFNYLTVTNTHERIAGISCGYDMVAGVFKDEDNRDGFLFANYDTPTSENINEVQVSFNNCTQVLCYINGKETALDVKNGIVEMSLNAGDWAFVIPLNIG